MTWHAHDLSPRGYRCIERRARQPHTCGECKRERIQPGDLYWWHKGCWSGRWATHKVCRRCQAARDAINPKIAGELAFGGLRDCLRERTNWRAAWRREVARLPGR